MPYKHFGSTRTNCGHTRIARVLKSGGDYLMIECFTDGLANNNKARADCGLPPIPEAHHNKYFDKDSLFNAIRNIFHVVDVREFGARRCRIALQLPGILTTSQKLECCIHPCCMASRECGFAEILRLQNFFLHSCRPWETTVRYRRSLRKGIGMQRRTRAQQSGWPLLIKE